MTRYDYLGEADFDLDAFMALIDEPTDPTRVRAATEIIDRVPVYDGAVIDSLLGSFDHDPHDAPVDPVVIRDLMAEWAWAIGSGPGALVVRGAIRDLELLDTVSAVFASIIESERDRAGAHADHFAAAGANDRVWNSHEKLCLADPELFMGYASTPTIAFAALAWLGPHYQITTQVNVVKPGADAQRPHRDYHLGFYTPDETLEFPVHVHEMSSMLTLQGAIAHDDIPLEMGPIKILPNSQRYTAGFAISERARFSEIFEERCMQIPMSKGDVPGGVSTSARCGRCRHDRTRRQASGGGRLCRGLRLPDLARHRSVAEGSRPRQPGPDHGARPRGVLGPGPLRRCARRAQPPPAPGRLSAIRRAALRSGRSAAG